jgi:hypothetical protein
MGKILTVTLDEKEIVEPAKSIVFRLREARLAQKYLFRLIGNRGQACHSCDSEHNPIDSNPKIAKIAGLL